MGKKCCVPKCKSGYDSVTFDPPIKISFHAFPPDSELRSEWKINISRPNWEPHLVLLFVHFTFMKMTFKIVARMETSKGKTLDQTGESLIA